MTMKDAVIKMEAIGYNYRSIEIELNESLRNSGLQESYGRFKGGFYYEQYVWFASGGGILVKHIFEEGK